MIVGLMVLMFGRMWYEMLPDHLAEYQYDRGIPFWEFPLTQIRR